MVKIGNDWDDILKNEFQKEYYLKIRNFLKNEYSTCNIYPHMNDIFNAFKYTSYKNTKVVILGQDPYHGKNQAHGLSFSVQKGILKPPSLQNIFKELKTDIGIDIPTHGDLTSWAKSGVLLLNASLTVKESTPNSHANCGWSIFTDNIISLLNQKEEPIVFILWGAFAKKKKSLITNNQHLILEAAHPSPFSAHNGFFGCKHFSKTNEFLSKYNKNIDWNIEN